MVGAIFGARGTEVGSTPLANHFRTATFYTKDREVCGLATVWAKRIVLSGLQFLIERDSVIKYEAFAFEILTWEFL